MARRHDDTVTTAVEELGLDDLPAGEVLIEVSWSSVNYKDGMVTVPGNRVTRLSARSCPVSTWPGVVVASDDPALAVGTEVLAHGGDLGVARHGGYAALRPGGAPGPPSRCPLGLSARHARAIGTAGFTAALALDQLEQRGLRPGDGPVLVTGASGGVGSFAVDLLARRGYEVVASTGKVDEHPWLERLGATHVIGRDELDEAGGRVLGPEHWAAAVDCVGGDTLARVLQSAALRRRPSPPAGSPGAPTCTAPCTPSSRAAWRSWGWTRCGPRSSDGARSGAASPPTCGPRISTTSSPGRCRCADVGGALADILAARVRGRLLVRVDAAR